MSGEAPALLAAAAGVGIGHAVMPDHWMPLAVVGRVNRYRSAKVAQLAGLAGAAHVVVSLLLGAVIVVVGLQFRHSIEADQDTIVGAILLATGVMFVGLELIGRGHHHGPGGHTHGPGGHHHGPGGHTHWLPGGHPHTHEPMPGARSGPPRSALLLAQTRGHRHPHGPAQAIGASRRRRLFTVIIPLGAAASPDLTILPVFLAAAAAGVATAIGTLVIFTLATVGTIVGLTVLAFLTGYRLEGNWLDRWGNVITAGVLLMVGALVVTQTI